MTPKSLRNKKLWRLIKMNKTRYDAMHTKSSLAQVKRNWGKNLTPIRICPDDEELMGEFIGLFAGDGCVNITSDYKYRVFLYFNITEKIYVGNLMEKVLTKLFGRKPRAYRDENRLNLIYYSKSIYNLINQYLTWDINKRKTYTVRLIEKPYSKDFTIGFLRGCLDSDGHLSNKRISFATVSTGLADNITQFLDKLSISYNLRLYKEKRINRKDVFHIEISRSDYDKFMILIKPRNLKGTYALAGIRIPES